MSLLKHLARHAAQESHMAKQHGEESKSTGFLLIACGLFLLPVPIIGIPLIIGGIIMLFK